MQLPNSTVTIMTARNVKRSMQHATPKTTKAVCRPDAALYCIPITCSPLLSDRLTKGWMSMCSRLLCEMHMALLRLLQADMEEAHAVAGQGLGAASIADKAISQSAACLEEAWAWGFDVDVWRAHLNALTWPEVRASKMGTYCDTAILCSTGLG